MREPIFYSRAERMGFWKSLVKKVKDLTRSPEGLTSKDREMIAIDESIQSRALALESILNEAKNSFDLGYLQESYKKLFNYNSILEGMLTDASSLIEFGEKHKIASRLFKMASADEAAHKRNRVRFERFIEYTMRHHENIMNIVSKLGKIRESRNTSNYISQLRKLKEAVVEFSGKLAQLNEQVVIKDKMRGQDIGGTIGEMARELHPEFQEEESPKLPAALNNGYYPPYFF